MGDVHYWAVWHAALPFSEYEKQHPRFMSEYGFQSFPNIETVNAYTLPTDHDIQSPVMMAHQKHPRGNQLIREYMLRDFPEPKDFESFLYASQVLQAEGIKTGTEHLRRIMPHNMGSLYWQINDCWPVASWSSIDYFGRWKALQYYARRFYNDLLVSPHEESGSINVYIVSDHVKASPAQLIVSLMDFAGHDLQTIKRDVNIAALESKSYLTIPATGLLQGRDPQSVFLECDLYANGKLVSSNRHFFAPFKQLKLSRPVIKTDWLRVKDGYKITLTSDVFAKAVYLSTGGADGFFTDNYFDLLPGRKIEVEFHPHTQIAPDAFRQRLKVRSLIDASGKAAESRQGL